MTAIPEPALRAVCFAVLTFLLVAPLSATAAIYLTDALGPEAGSVVAGCTGACASSRTMGQCAGGSCGAWPPDATPCLAPAPDGASCTSTLTDTFELPPSFLHPSEKLMAMPDPAAAYCEALGYTYETADGEGGQRGVVLLPDGRRVDAWDFYRGKCAQEYSYCERNGYRTRTKKQERGSFTTECAVCVDSEGREMGTVRDLMELEFGTQPSLMGKRAVPLKIASAFGSRPPGDIVPPDRYDWRTLDGCTSVKAQGNCGSCWAFSTVGAFECNILIKDGVEVDLSEQYLVSCNHHGWSCGGGGFAHRYHLRTKDPCDDYGAVLEGDFYYQASDVPCQCPYDHPYVLDGWAYIDDSVDIPDTDSIKRAIMEYGPVSVGVWVSSTFSAYNGGVYTGGPASDINHAVVLVGWDDDQGPEGVWFLRNSWGTMWGEYGYMRIAYGANAVGWRANWVDYRTPIQISYPYGLPGVVEAGEPTDIIVSVDEHTDSYVPSTGTMHYRMNGGSFSLALFEPVGRGLYRATLPAAVCGDTPEFFFAASGSRYGTVYSPRDAATNNYACVVGSTETVFADDFESDLGWTVENDPGLTAGAWERGIPEGEGYRSDPPTDHDGSGHCFLTSNVYGDSDVDNGTTALVSPSIDLTGGDDAVVQFAFWYRNDQGDNPNNDNLFVYMSDDDGLSWTRVDSVGPRAPLPIAWHERTYRVGDHVSVTDGFKVKMAVGDLGSGSVVEAGVDDFSVSYLSCDPTSVATAHALPDVPVLHPNLPNPFNPSTVLSYDLPEEAEVSLVVLSASGRVVRTLVDGSARGPGPHKVVWDGRDDAGHAVASGAYFYRLEVGNEAVLRKMLLLK